MKTCVNSQLVNRMSVGLAQRELIIFRVDYGEFGVQL
jgi:hypothetical protein